MSSTIFWWKDMARMSRVLRLNLSKLPHKNWAHNHVSIMLRIICIWLYTTVWSGSAHFGMHSHLRIMENTFEKNHYTHMRQRLQTSFNKAVSFYMHGAGCYHLCNDIKRDSRHLCASPQITVYSFLPSSLFRTPPRTLPRLCILGIAVPISTPPFYLCNAFTFTYGNCKST